ncbi:MAG: DUF4831 family protein [Bacteroidales bacterium]|nr:DUF4831 family protein [Bacteroidales bacterium]MDD4669743.1 DUF4831 family protein [Bacteroidales bacterium]
MSNLFKTGLCALMVGISAATFAQTNVNAIPNGAVIYSLPNTSISLSVEATSEIFTAGPYARYAQKYLGAEARTQDEVSYRLGSIQFVPYIEADPNSKIAINLNGKGVAAANFLQFCAQGLIITSDSYTGKSESWRFPSIANNDQFAGKGVGGNLTSTTTTLYKTVRTENGFRRVAVPQNQVVEKSAEKKAEEIANSIFDLRRQRVQIITGNTDATFSGEALGAAIAEINRLEQEYLSLFFGVTETSIQKMSFDVIPRADNPKQIYVAFRISDTQGLLPANNMSGRPIVLELTIDQAELNSAITGNVQSGKSKEQQLIYYRVPAVATAKIMDGQTLLLQTRVPVYQLGRTLSFPIDIAISK